MLLQNTLLGAAPRESKKKGFGFTYARKIEPKKMSQRTICATPKIFNLHFRQWWQLSTSDCYFMMLTLHPPGFCDVVARGFCMRMQLRG